MSIIVYDTFLYIHIIFTNEINRKKLETIQI